MPEIRFRWLSLKEAVSLGILSAGLAFGASDRTTQVCQVGATAARLHGQLRMLMGSGRIT
jgi:hypothetical protein